MTAEQDRFLTAQYHKQRLTLLEYALSVLRSHALAEEAVQQAFEIACMKIDDFCTSPNPAGWLHRTLTFVLRNIQSRQRTESKVIVPADKYRLELVAAPADPVPLRLCFGELLDSPQFQLVYEMEILGKTLQEIAAEQGISLSACKKRAERARKYLRKKLKN